MPQCGPDFLLTNGRVAVLNLSLLDHRMREELDVLDLLAIEEVCDGLSCIDAVLNRGLQNRRVLGAVLKGRHTFDAAVVADENE